MRATYAGNRSSGSVGRLSFVLVVCPCLAILHRPLAWYTVSDEQLYVDMIMLGPWFIFSASGKPRNAMPSLL